MGYGEEVLSMGNGTIASSCKGTAADGQGHSWLVINHDNGAVVSYLHLGASSITKTTGRVSKGEVIGRISTRDSDNQLANCQMLGWGSHIHLGFKNLPQTIDGTTLQAPNNNWVSCGPDTGNCQKTGQYAGWSFTSQNTLLPTQSETTTQGDSTVYAGAYSPSERAWKVFKQAGATTNISPAITEHNGKLWMLVRSNNIFYLKNTENGSVWSNSISIGRSGSDGLGDIVSHNGKLYVFHQGGGAERNKIYFSRTNDGVNWDFFWRESPFQSSTSPRVVSFNNKIYLVYTNKSDNKIKVQVYNESNNTWQDLGQIRDGVANTPVSVTVHNNKLFVAHKGLGVDIYVSSSSDGQNWSSWVKTQRGSEMAPSITSAGGRLYLLHKGSGETKFYMGNSTDGVTWGDWNNNTHDSRSYLNGYITSFKDNVFLAYRGTGSEIEMPQGSFIPTGIRDNYYSTMINNSKQCRAIFSFSFSQNIASPGKIDVLVNGVVNTTITSYSKDTQRQVDLLLEPGKNVEIEFVANSNGVVYRSSKYFSRCNNYVDFEISEPSQNQVFPVGSQVTVKHQYTDLDNFLNKIKYTLENDSTKEKQDFYVNKGSVLALPTSLKEGKYNLSAYLEYKNGAYERDDSGDLKRGSVSFYYTSQNTPCFPDVPLSHTFNTYICNLKKDRVIGGYGDGRYAPNDQVTRGQMAVFIKNGFNIPEDTSCGDFPDVPKTHSFYKHITSLKCAGVISGYGDGRYGPNDRVTRGQMAVFIQNASKKSPTTNEIPNNTSCQNFPDVPESHVFYRYITSLRCNNIISGYGDGRYGPNDRVTRGQMAVFVDKARKY